MTPFAGNLVDRYTAGRAAVLTGLGVSIGLAGIGLVGDWVLLAALLFVVGLINGGMEVAANSCADTMEKATGTRIMARAHGCWSLGFMSGAIVAGLFAGAGVPYGIHLAVIAVAGVAAAFGLTKLVPSLVFDRVVRHPDAEKTPVFALPNRATIGICVMAIGVTLAEGAVYDWGTLFLREDIGAEPFPASATYAVFMLAMACGRMGGDWIRDHFSSPAIVRVCALLSGLGLLGFVLAPDVIVAGISLAVMGFGVSLVFPVAVSAIAARGGPSAAANMAQLTLAVMGALLLGPPVIGIIADTYGLATSFLLLLPFVALTGLLASEGAAKPKPGVALSSAPGTA
jgi:MFS family permease